jgi:DNA (cytosine-5)-methyltransferase 1
MKAVELFAGAGGLALGASQAGFDHLALIELDRDACETIRENQHRRHPIAVTWPLHQVDVRDFDYSKIPGEVDLLSAGVPCQPFSVAGKGQADQDKRDMFSEVVRAVRDLKPRAVLVENVKGLLRDRFKDYFDYLLLALASPGFVRGAQESWREHHECLKKHADVGAHLRYETHVHALNAADHGVPQWRERVFIVAFRSDLGVSWTPPPATHSLDALLWSQYVTHDYWKRHGLNRKLPGAMTRRFADRLRALIEVGRRPADLEPWRTVRDAIGDLPKAREGEQSPLALNHFLNPGARAYRRHSGSFLDEPAKTLKAGSHGVPGGENTLALGAGKVRYFSVRECARFQAFPDDYFIAGTWTRSMRQVGNAVPVTLGRLLSARIAEHLNVADPRSAVVLPFRRIA